MAPVNTPTREAGDRPVHGPAPARSAPPLTRPSLLATHVNLKPSLRRACHAVGHGPVRPEPGQVRVRVFSRPRQSRVAARQSVAVSRLAPASESSPAEPQGLGSRVNRHVRRLRARVQSPAPGPRAAAAGTIRVEPRASGAAYARRDGRRKARYKNSPAGPFRRGAGSGGGRPRNFQVECTPKQPAAAQWPPRTGRRPG